MSNYVWSNAELDYVRNNYRKLSDPQLSEGLFKRFGRRVSPGAVRQKRRAHRLLKTWQPLSLR